MVVAAVLQRGDRILLCHRSPRRRWFPNVWDFPGGHVRAGEPPADALRRELEEELGVELEGVEREPLLRSTDPEVGLQLTVWLSRQWRGTVVNRQPEEHDAIEWFEREQLDGLRLAVPSYLPLLRGLLTVEGGRSAKLSPRDAVHPSGTAGPSDSRP